LKKDSKKKKISENDTSKSKRADKATSAANEENSKDKKKCVWRRIRIGVFVFLFSLIFLITAALAGVAAVFDNYVVDVIDKVSGSSEVTSSIGDAVSAVLMSAITGEEIDIDKIGASFDESNIKVFPGLSDEVKNVAVFGVDSRENNDSGSRSDAMMIVSFDMKHNKVKAVSIMRDSLVSIPGYKNRSKINSAYAKGGVELAINTINENFKMNINDYIVLNFNQMASVVDAVDGIEVEISEAERKNANKYIREMAEENNEKPNLIKKSGTVTLYGHQAVAYARIRAVGNADFERTERQREVMEKIMNKVLSAGVMEYPDIINALVPMLKTSLSRDEITKMMGHVISNGKPTFEQGRFPMDGTFTTNEYYAMEYDMEEAADKLHRFIYDDEPFYS